MKHLTCFVFLALYALSAVGQGDIRFAITLYNIDKTVAKDIAIEAREVSRLKKMKCVTDSYGKASMLLEDGKQWSISIGEMKDCIRLEAKDGTVMTTTRTVYYDVNEYNRRKKQDPRRTLDGFNEVEQNVNEHTAFDPGNCMLTLILRQPDGKLLSGIDLALVNVEDSIVYRAKTNVQGRANFLLPKNTSYDIDVNETKNHYFFDHGDEYVHHTIQLVYAPTKTKEILRNDTVFQQLDASTVASTDRAFMQIHVRGGKRQGIRENVYLRQQPSGRVFTATTNDKGAAHFLLPIRFVYMVDFEHQKNVNAVNLLHANEITTGSMVVNYNPDPRLEYPETFIPTPDRLMQQSFQDFLQKQYEKPRERPFRLTIRAAKRLNAKSREAMFLVTLAGSDSYSKVRLPLNAALVLDKSGSMFDNGRADALKRALMDIRGIIIPPDKIEVVLFADDGYLIPREEVTLRDHLKLIAEYYTPDGGTNILSGLEIAAKTVKRSMNDQRASKIILMTDGYDNNPPMEVTDFVEKAFSEGIEFSTIGVGTDYNQSLLELIAIKGNGSFTYIDESTMLSSAFQDELNKTFQYGAKDLRIEVFYNKEMIFSNLFGYPVKEQDDDRVTFEVGKVPNETNKIAFLKFKLKRSIPALEQQPLLVKVRYFDMVKQEIVSYEESVPLAWTEETETEFLIDHHEKELYAIAILNQSMKMMAEAHSKGDHAAAQEALKSGKEQMEEIYPEAKPKEVEILFNEVIRYLGLFDQMAKNAAR